MLATHRLSDRSVAVNMETALQEPVVDRSVIGARTSMRCRSRAARGSTSPSNTCPATGTGWSSMAAATTCGSAAAVVCDGKLDRLISEDGRKGRIPGFLSKLRQSGAKVVYVGYLRSPGRGLAHRALPRRGGELERPRSPAGRAGCRGALPVPAGSRAPWRQSVSRARHDPPLSEGQHRDRRARGGPHPHPAVAQ